MKSNDIISGLEFLLKESKAAEAKLEFSNAVERLQRRVSELEDENKKIINMLRIMLNK